VVAEETLEVAEHKFEEAHQYLEMLKTTVGGGQGSIWWMERELEEAKKYLPKRKQ